MEIGTVDKQDLARCVDISGANEEGDDNKPVPTVVALDQETLGAMVEALKAYEVTSNLPDEILEDICLEAFSAGKMNDISWLEEKLRDVVGEDISLDALVSQGSDQNNNVIDKEVLNQIHVSEVAAIESEDDLREVLRLHEVWINSVLNPRAEMCGGRANFRGLDLSGFDFSGVDLRCADFRNANLAGANLYASQLSNAWLQNANLRGANLEKAKLKRAKLDGADFTDANLTGVDLNAADFSKCILEGSIRD
ncbi:MAG: pentapeptide repeat-containing protein [Bdellovibrionota bacterium]